MKQPRHLRLDRLHDSRKSVSINIMSKAEPLRLAADVIERIGAARAGDEHALEDLIRQYQNRIARYVIALIGASDADFDDLCQIVFVKMALALPKLRSPEVFEPWLYTIARNVCRDHLRRLRFRERLIPLSRDHEATSVGPEADEPPAGPDALDAALERLPGAQRELIDLLRRREYSYEELARLLKISVRAVAGRLFRARSRLRKLLRYNGAGQ
jgi:RNA polymerase sigma-70 factor (ECF subfamily)